MSATGRQTGAAAGTGTKISAETKEEGKEYANDVRVHLFGSDEREIRVTLYRDLAAWCPYCPYI